MIWPLGLYHVVGDSMLPTYRANDLLLGYRWAKPKSGNVVVVLNNKRHIVKRIVKQADQAIWLEGDNRHGSTDSRDFGWLATSSVEAVIVAKLGRKR